MTTGKWLLAGSLVLALLPGCGSSDAGDAPQKCENMLTLFCSGTIACEVSGGFIDPSEAAARIDSCNADLSKQAQCSNAKRVSSQYDDCISALANPSCAEINQTVREGMQVDLPAECVIITN